MLPSNDLALVGFQVQYASGYKDEPGVGKTHVTYQMVTGLRIPDRPTLRFIHHQYLSLGKLPSPKIVFLPFPQDMADRLYEFANEVFVNGRDRFNCFTFLSFLMGWIDTIEPTISVTTRTTNGIEYQGSRGPDVISKLQVVQATKPNATKELTPYLVSRNQSVYPHALLGIGPDKNLAVAGPNQPLVIADNAMVLKAFGGVELLEVAWKILQQTPSAIRGCQYFTIYHSYSAPY